MDLSIFPFDFSPAIDLPDPRPRRKFLDSSSFRQDVFLTLSLRVRTSAGAEKRFLTLHSFSFSKVLSRQCRSNLQTCVFGLYEIHAVLDIPPP